MLCVREKIERVPSRHMQCATFPGENTEGLKEKAEGEIAGLHMVIGDQYIMDELLDKNTLEREWAKLI